MRQRQLFGETAVRDEHGELLHRVSVDAQLVPPPLLMLQEADEILEDWFAGGAEQSCLLRLLGCVSDSSQVVEVGCGLGRLAFALRRILTRGSYIGLDVVEEKITFLRERMSPLYPTFRFEWMDVCSDFYHPDGRMPAMAASFPCPTGWADAIVAMSLFTHLLPDGMRRYLEEMSRALKPSGRCVISVCLLDYYQASRPRPVQFAERCFNFDDEVDASNGMMRTSDATCPEAMLAVNWSFLRELAQEAGLVPVCEPLPGMWSGTQAGWTSGQDVVVLSKA